MRRISVTKAFLRRCLSSLGAGVQVCPTLRWGPTSKLADLDLVRVYLGFLIWPTRHSLLIVIDLMLLRSLQVSLELWQAICELLALNV